MKKILGIISIMVGINGIQAATNDAVIEKKIDDLLKQMTLQEKIGQLNQLNGEGEKTGPVNETVDYISEIKKGNVGSMLNVNGVEYTRRVQKVAIEQTRLHIPLIFGYDVIHGYKTIMPIPLAEACSWDLNAIEKSARFAAIEASASGQHWSFGPMVDIARDARWGRIMEGAGEDPYWGSLVAKARIKGFQGNDLSANNTIAACAKHYAGYGFAEAGKDYNATEITEHTMRNVVLPPFKACVEADAATFMNAFHDLGGVPCTGNVHLVREILKGEWGFNGFIVSDWASVEEMITHGIAADKSEASKLAIKAGCDMDMEGKCYVSSLETLVKNGSVKEELINDAVRRILRIKFKLGLFDDPYRYCDEKREKTEVLTKAALDFSREMGRKSIVLLKNQDNTLPLGNNFKKIAVIGALANDKDAPLGNWRGKGGHDNAVSLVEGMVSKFGKDKVQYSEGAKLVLNTEPIEFPTKINFNENDRSGFSAAIENAKTADVVVFAIGETAYQSGEARSVSDLKPKGLQLELLGEILKVNKNVVLVLMGGRPLDISQYADKVSSIVEAWHLGSQAGNSIADVLSGDYNPSAKLTISYPRTVGQVPIYYNHKNSGRPMASDPDYMVCSRYTDNEVTPLFPFGYGLSYTNFDYSGLSLSKPEINMNESLEVKVTVKNTGTCDGEEAVQLYIRDIAASVTRPVKELKGFQKIFLKQGESKDVVFTLTSKDLAFYNASNEFTAESGKFKLFVGKNSQDVLESEFILK